MRRIVTADDYFAAAIDLLVDEGGSHLRVGNLCSSLGVTSGSFYGYFPSFNTFVEDLMTSRLADQNRRLEALSQGAANDDARLVALRELARRVPHRAEAAIRSWVQGHPTGAVIQRRLDDQRVDALVGVLLPVVGSPSVARKLGEMGMSFLIGWPHLYAETDARDFDCLFDEYESAIRAHRSSRQLAGE